MFAAACAAAMLCCAMPCHAMLCKWRCDCRDCDYAGDNATMQKRGVITVRASDACTCGRKTQTVKNMLTYICMYICMHLCVDIYLQNNLQQKSMPRGNANCCARYSTSHVCSQLCLYVSMCVCVYKFVFIWLHFTSVNLSFFSYLL